jgi:hypothetical protein
VFLALTGRAAEDEQPGKRRRGRRGGKNADRTDSAQVAS